MKLSERVERLEGPDREIDQLIAIEHRSTPERRVIGVANCKPYTASLDAAMSLVPEGRSWEVTKYALDGRSEAFIWNMQETGEGDFGDAKTPAIALCAAALKARGL